MSFNLKKKQILFKNKRRLFITYKTFQFSKKSLHQKLTIQFYNTTIRADSKQQTKKTQLTKSKHNKAHIIALRNCEYENIKNIPNYVNAKLKACLCFKKKH